MQPQPNTGLGPQAAKGSWASAVIVVLLVLFAGSTGASPAIELTALILMTVGVALGIVALFGIPKHGTKGILAPSLVGIIINGLLVFIFLTNFLAARARAQQGANTVVKFRADTSASRQEDGGKEYEDEELAFGFDGAYELTRNRENGQILLQNSDSSVVVTSHRELVDPIEAVKFKASELQLAYRTISSGEVTLDGPKTVNGSIRSGSLMRMEYDKPGVGRVHADLYILRNQTNTISVVHIYPDRRKTKASGLFQTLLRSLKDGI